MKSLFQNRFSKPIAEILLEWILICACLPFAAHAQTPLVTLFKINNGQEATLSKVVTLTSATNCAASQYQASEDKKFTGAAWKRYALASRFTLKPNTGKHTLYFRVKCGKKISSAARASIKIVTGKPVVVKSIALNGGSSVTQWQSVMLSSSTSQPPAYLMYSEDPRFPGAAWSRYIANAPVLLSANEGSKTIYFKVKLSNGLESAPASASITYDAPPELTNIVVNGGVSAVVDRDITLSLAALGTPTLLFITETQDDTAMSWVPFSPNVAFHLTPLSTGTGTKHLYITIADANNPPRTYDYPVQYSTNSESSSSESSSSSSSSSADTIKETVSATSPKQQTVQYQDKLTVSIPPGALNGTQTLTIAPASALPPPKFPGFEVINAYDVSFSDQHEFALPIELGFPYDPSQALMPSGDGGESQSFAGGYIYNGTWVYEPQRVNTVTKTVTVAARHFSVRGELRIKQGYKPTVLPGDHFRIIANSNVNAPFGGVAGFQGVVSNYLTDHWNNYALQLGGGGQHLKMPSQQIDVFIDQYDPDETVVYGGNIDVPTSYYDESELKFGLAHELFHAIQNSYMNLGSMWLGRWFMEASADWAARNIAGGDAKWMAQKLDGHFLEHGIEYDPNQSDFHKYQAAWFLDYLAGSNPSTFVEMVDSVLSSSYPPDIALSTWNQGRTGRSISEAYQGFAEWFLFDANSPGFPAEKSLYTEGTAARTSFSREEDQTSQSLSLEPLSAKLWGIEADNTDASRLVEVEASGLGNFAAIQVYASKIGERTTYSRLATLTSANSKTTVVVPAAHWLFVLFVNPSIGLNYTPSVTVTDKSPKIDSITPEPGTPGDLVTITGKNFGDDQTALYLPMIKSDGTISLGALHFNPGSSVSDTQIKAFLPSPGDAIVQPGKYKIQVQKSGYFGGVWTTASSKNVEYRLSMLKFYNNKRISVSVLGTFMFTNGYGGPSSISGSLNDSLTQRLDGVINLSGTSFTMSASGTATGGYGDWFTVSRSFEVSGSFDELGSEIVALHVRDAATGLTQTECVAPNCDVDHFSIEMLRDIALQHVPLLSVDSDGSSDFSVSGNNAKDSITTLQYRRIFIREYEYCSTDSLTHLRTCTPSTSDSNEVISGLDGQTVTGTYVSIRPPL